MPPTPCTQWITGDDVAAAGCTVLTGTGIEYDDVAEKASDVLFILSGMQFPGLCERTVRPCSPTGCCGRWAGTWGGVYTAWAWPLVACGCCHLSTVKLPGTVREVSEVKIDGAVIDPSGYRVDKAKYLVRLADADGNGQTWPGCQRLDLDDTEDGTFSVTYSYGQDPPIMGLNAAVALACELAKASVGVECLLPAGVTKVTRQGITIDIGTARAGLLLIPDVALFLEAYNPTGMRRRATVWSPDSVPFAQKVGP